MACDLGSFLESTMTPTMVSNFNLPNSSKHIVEIKQHVCELPNLFNSDVNKNGTYLEITEQPQTKFRFRYQSEMVGTHGQLKAENSSKTNNIYPTVKVAKIFYLMIIMMIFLIFIAQKLAWRSCYNKVDAFHCRRQCK